MTANIIPSDVVLCDDPMIRIIDLFLTPTECQHIISIANNKGFEKSKVFGANERLGELKRNSQTVWVVHNYDEAIHRIVQRISDLIGISLEYAESLQVVHYAENGKFDDHYDGWNHNLLKYQCVKNGGQRLITCMIYLNEPLEGGETRFTYKSIRIKPTTGRLLIFSNVIDGTNRLHPLSKHGGLPVIRGDKYVCNLWFRENKI